METEKEFNPSIQKRVREFSAEARAWQCKCGEITNPSGALWRWNGSQWEHAHETGHFSAERKAKKVAHDTGDGWWIGEENLDGDLIIEDGIEWPKDWPSEVSARFLREHGYEIV